MKFFLIGLPGCGKSTLGKKIAKHYSLNFIDLDKEIEISEHLSIQEIFDSKGEDYFRNSERNALKNTQNIENAIISTGGGTPCFYNNMDWMNQNGTTIYLNINIEDIKRNLDNSAARPILATNSIEQLLDEREIYYEKAKFRISSIDEFMILFKELISK